ARATFRQALHWLRERPPEPYFLFIHTYEVHTPYLPPQSHLRVVSSPERLRARPIDKAVLYDAEVRTVDHVLGRFLARMANEGLLDRARTVLAVTADHGESFGEHGHWAHGTCLHDEVMHVPLIFAGPGIRSGLRVRPRAGLVDVAPTLLEL